MNDSSECIVFMLSNTKVQLLYSVRLTSYPCNNGDGLTVSI
jgi:hypothetical protein